MVVASVVISSCWRLEGVECRHSSSVVQIEIRTLILNARVGHDSSVLVLLSLSCLHILRVLHRTRFVSRIG